MSANIVHFGMDDCCRLLVLRSVGYTVDVCTSVISLACVLARDESVDAVAINESQAYKAEEVITIARSRSSAPLILFEGPDSHYDKSKFDLVIPVLSSPNDWLKGMAATIEQSRMFQAQSRLLREQSSALRAESAAVRQRLLS